MGVEGSVGHGVGGRAGTPRLPSAGRGELSSGGRLLTTWGQRWGPRLPQGRPPSRTWGCRTSGSRLLQRPSGLTAGTGGRPHEEVPRSVAHGGLSWPWRERAGAGVVALTSQAVPRWVKPAPEGWHPPPAPPTRAWDAGGCCTASLGGTARPLTWVVNCAVPQLPQWSGGDTGSCSARRWGHVGTAQRTVVLAPVRPSWPVPSHPLALPAFPAPGTVLAGSTEDALAGAGTDHTVLPRGTGTRDSDGGTGGCCRPVTCHQHCVSVEYQGPRAAGLSSHTGGHNPCRMPATSPGGAAGAGAGAGPWLGRWLSLSPASVAAAEEVETGQAAKTRAPQPLAGSSAWRRDSPHRLRRNSPGRAAAGSAVPPPSPSARGLWGTAARHAGCAHAHARPPGWGSCHRSPRPRGTGPEGEAGSVRWSITAPTPASGT